MCLETGRGLAEKHGGAAVKQPPPFVVVAAQVERVQGDEGQQQWW
jgi:hypothetical protein